MSTSPDTKYVAVFVKLDHVGVMAHIVETFAKAEVDRIQKQVIPGDIQSEKDALWDVSKVVGGAQILLDALDFMIGEAQTRETNGAMDAFEVLFTEPEHAFLSKLFSAKLSDGDRERFTEEQIQQAKDVLSEVKALLGAGRPVTKSQVDAERKMHAQETPKPFLFGQTIVGQA